MAIANPGAFTNTGTFPLDCYNANYQQSANIDCTGKTMLPIGTSNGAYSGTYDGQGFTVSNWQNNQSNTSGIYFGMFGWVSTGTIKNVVMNGVIKVMAGGYVGALIGNATGAVNIRNIVINGSLNSTITASLDYVGGAIGYLNASSGTCNNIQVTGFLNLTGRDNIGGCIGTSFIASVELFSSFTGNITGRSSIGGILSEQQKGNVTACINSITGNMITAADIAGGIVGYSGAQGTVLSCTNMMNGDIRVGGNFAGGIVGYYESSGYIQDCVTGMIGNIVCSSLYSGGLGYAVPNQYVNMLRCCVATKGDIAGTAPNNPATIIGSKSPNLNCVNCVYSNVNSMTLNSTVVTSSTAYSTYVTLTTFPSQLSGGSFTGGLSSTKLPVWSYTYTDPDSLSRTVVFGALPPTVAWVLTGGFYQVSTINHLMAIASPGSFTNTGSFPSNFLTASYQQSANIDCTGKTMIPIGAPGVQFLGIYDGQLFSISNWQNNQSNSADKIGLFGVLGSSTVTATVKNVTMNGVIKALGGSYIGALVGQALLANCRNIIINGSSGSVVTGTNAGGTFGQYVGGAVGGIQISNGNYNNIKISGYLTVTSFNNYCGGCIGGDNAANNTIREINVSFTGNVVCGNEFVGGIIGKGANDLTACVNSINGNISGTHCGGIVGYLATGTVASCTNIMTGSLSGANYVGGIVGEFSQNTTIQDAVTAMTGNVVCSALTSGGIAYGTAMTGTSLTRCCVATKGNIAGTAPAVPATVLGTTLTATSCVYSNVNAMTLNSAVVTTSSSSTTNVPLTAFPSQLAGGSFTGGLSVSKSLPVWSYTYTDPDSLSRTVVSGIAALSLSGGAVTDGYVGAVVVSGGQQPYSYSWALSTAPATIVLKTAGPLNAATTGTYVLTVTDSLASTVTGNYVVTANTVNWTVANSIYQVLTVKHLMCIASLGNGFNTTGTPPASQALYASSNYAQTADIDCAGIQMVPIGLYGGISYSGKYDGAGFKVLNWQNNQSSTADNQGFFGSASGTLLNITMGGVINVKGGSSVGAVLGSTGGMNCVNIIVAFAAGSTIIGSGNNVGGAVGYAGQYTNFTCGRISGTVNITGSSSVGGYMGNIHYSAVQDVISTISGTITGANYVGGVLGGDNLAGAVACINQMTGNIVCSGQCAGGVVGYGSITTCTNAMIGNITGATYVGGVAGNSGTYQDCINTMTGNIVSTTNSTNSGGIGYSSNMAYTRCVVAVNGNVPSILMNEALITNQLSLFNNVYSNKFGMTVAGATKPYDATLNTVLQSFNTFPYALTTAGSIKMWDAVRSVPYFVYNYTDNSSVARSTRITDNGYKMQTITVSAPSTTNQFANSTLTWSAVPSNGYYKIMVNPEDATDTVSVTSTTALTSALGNLFCGTGYIASLYASTDNTTFVDTGNRVFFNTSSCSTFNKNPTATTVLSPTWTAVNTLTSYRVTVKNVATTEFVSAGPTSGLTADTTGLSASVYYILTLQGSSDGTTFVRLATPVSHTTLPLVLWTQDASSKYQVKSVLHLTVIALNGVGYASGSVVPANYSTASYVQFNNIDCSGTTMIPIGNVVSFNGVYNGQGYQIVNWQNDQTTTASNQGLFGNGNATLTNIAMSGVIKVKGASNIGAVLGQSGGVICTNISLNFSAGSLITGTGSNVGGAIGFAGQYTSITNGRVAGAVSITGTSNVGGFMGLVNYSTPYDIISTITGNVTGSNSVGGVIGNSNNGQVLACINQMTGNVVCTGSTVGGVVGNASDVITCTNAMVGNVQGTTAVGGLAGNSNTYTDDINIMQGNIISTTNSTTSGGIGYSYALSYTRCVVATSGNVPSLLMNEATITNQLTLNSNVYSNKFGMTVAGSAKAYDATLNTVLQSFNTFPYALTTAGTIKMWDPVRSVPYSVYSYNNGVARTTRMTNNGFAIQTVAVSAPSTTNQFANTTLTWTAVPSNGYYRIKVNAEDSTDTVSIASTTTVTAALSGLFCGTAYIASLYASADNATFSDTGVRVAFNTPACSTFNKNPTQTTVLSPIWTAVTPLTSYRVTVKNVSTTEFVSAGPTAALTADTTGLSASVYYVLTLQGSADGTTFVRLATPVTHTTLPLVLWTQDSASKYQVKTVLHLTVMALNGVGYASGSVVPANYSTASYVQANDIDCAGTTMISIGNVVVFNGVYNGQGYKINNWQNDQTTTVSNQGLFGQANGTLINISMGGVIKVKGGGNLGALLGYTGGVTCVNTVINFAAGSTISGTANTGGAIGYGGQYDNISRGRISGSVSITGSTSVGGFIGNIHYSSVSDIVSTITGTISGSNSVGGILGGDNLAGATACVNNMTGSIVCTGPNVGGIAGYGSVTIATNNMVGSITGTTYVGGICGNGGAFQDCINTMTGNIVSTTNSTNSGGIGFTGSNSFTRCVVATTGNVPSVLMNEALFPAISFTAVNNVYSNKFGMTVNNATATVLSNSYYKQVPLTSYPTTELTTAGAIKYFDTTLFVPYWSYTYNNTSLGSVTLVADPLQTALVVTSTVTQPTAGLINGAVTLVVSGGQFQSYSYAWTKDGTAFSSAQNLTALDQGLYVCTITSGTSTYSVTAQIYLGLLVVGGAVTAPTSFASATGTIAAPISVSGTPPYSYKWTVLSGGGYIYVQNAAQSGLFAGNYTLKITDSAGNAGTVAYTVPSPMTVVPAITSSSNGSNGAITLAVSYGAAPYSFAWSYYGAAAGTTQNLTGLKAGAYSCVVTTAAETKTVAVTVPGSFALVEQLQFNGTVLPIPALAGVTGPTSAAVFVAGPVPGQQGVYLNADAIVLPYTASLNYSSSLAFSFGGWLKQSSSGTSHFLSSAGNTGTLTGLDIQVTNASTVSLNGWSANGQTLQISSAITTILNTWIHLWVTFDGTVMTLYVNGLSVGTSTLSTAVTFTSTTGWIIGNNSARDSTPFVGSIADVRFYSGFVPPAVGSGPQLVCSAGSVVNSTSSFFGNGAIGISTAPSFSSIVWTSTGSPITDQTLALKTGLLPGVYAFTITTASGLTGWASSVVSGPLVVTVTNNQPSTGSSGALAVSVLGGASVYSYLWSNGATTAAISNLAAGVYSCTVTSASYTAIISDTVTAAMTLIATNSTVNVSFPAVTNATYTIRYILGTLTTTFIKRSVFNAAFVTGLIANTTYQFLVYNGSTLLYKTSVTTLASTGAVTYTATALATGNVVAVAKIPSTLTLTKEQIINAVFSTGSVIQALYETSNFEKIQVSTTLVTNLGTTPVPAGNGALFIPFDALQTYTQTITLILSDSSTLAIPYSPSTNTVIINGVVLGSNQMISLDGRTVIVQAV